MNQEAHLKHQLKRMSDNGITQKQIADEIGSTQPNVSAYFKSKNPSNKALDRYDDAIDKLIDEVEKQ